MDLQLAQQHIAVDRLEARLEEVEGKAVTDDARAQCAENRRRIEGMRATLAKAAAVGAGPEGWTP
jgi:hypothetical protein